MAAPTHFFLFMCVVTLLVALTPQWHERAQADYAQLVVDASAAPFSSPALPSPAPAPINCTSACQFRCSKASRANVCLRACGTCCHRCSCVPPGTAGNQEACGTCYTKQKTHDQAIKCP